MWVLGIWLLSQVVGGWWLGYGSLLSQVVVVVGCGVVHFLSQVGWLVVGMYVCVEPMVGQ